jgi:hypothetical protein
VSRRDTLVKIAFLTGGTKSISLGAKAIKGIDTLLELPGRGLFAASAPIVGGVAAAPVKVGKGLGRSAIAFAKKHPFLAATAAAPVLFPGPITELLSPQALAKVAVEPLAPSALIKPTAEFERSLARDAAQSQQNLPIFARMQDPRFPATSKYQWGLRERAAG